MLFDPKKFKGALQKEPFSIKYLIVLSKQNLLNFTSHIL